MDEDLPLAAVMAAAVARDSDPQLERMTHDRDVGDPTLDAVSVDPRDAATRTPTRISSDQIAEHDRRLAGNRGVGDPYSEFDRADDRVGDDVSGRRRRLHHRAPGGCWALV